MDFSDRIRSYQAKAIYSDLANRSSQLGSNCQLSSNCTSVGCKVNFLTYGLRDQVRQGRADCTGQSNLLPVYVGPTLSNRAF
jgi:hypothetical protein